MRIPYTRCQHLFKRCCEGKLRMPLLLTGAPRYAHTMCMKQNAKKSQLRNPGVLQNHQMKSGTKSVRKNITLYPPIFERAKSIMKLRAIPELSELLSILIREEHERRSGRPPQPAPAPSRSANSSDVPGAESPAAAVVSKIAESAVLRGVRGRGGRKLKAPQPPSPAQRSKGTSATT